MYVLTSESDIDVSKLQSYGRKPTKKMTTIENESPRTTEEHVVSHGRADGIF